MDVCRYENIILVDHIKVLHKKSCRGSFVIIIQPFLPLAF